MESGTRVNDCAAVQGPGIPVSSSAEDGGSVGCRRMVSSLTRVDLEGRGVGCRGYVVWMCTEATGLAAGEASRQECWISQHSQLFHSALLCSHHLALLHSICGTAPLQLFA